MIVGLNGFFLDKPVTGSGQYAVNLLRELASMATVQLKVFCPSPASASAASKILAPFQNPNGVIDVKPPVGANIGKVLFEQMTLPQACNKAAVDLLHVPYFGSPLHRSFPVVVTVHDLISLVLPPYRRSFLVKAYAALVSEAAKAANVVIADSEFTRQDIIRLLRITDARVVVVPLACDDRFRPDQDPDHLEAVRLKYGLSEPFVLYLGGLDIRKNIAMLIRAFGESGSDWQLVIAGEPYGGAGELFPNLVEVARQSGVEERTKFLGMVAEEDKPALYSLASLFVFPSVYEGFGLTPLEAMACGAPVLCSNATSLPEVVGDAALLFDPHDERQLADLFASAISDEGLRKDLSERGLTQAAKFSWRRTAEETLAAYQMA